jgi:hypothetical protein
MTQLTSAETVLIARARQLAEVHGVAAVKEHAGEADLAMAYGVTLAEAQHLLAELARIAERLGDA